MSPELRWLAWSLLLGLLHLVLAAAAARGQSGLAWALGPRDTPQPPLTGMAGRLQRAQANFMETFPFFLGAVLLVQLSGRGGSASALGAAIYVWARLAYLPLYAAGVPYLRTLAWGVSVAGLLMVLGSALPWAG